MADSVNLIKFINLLTWARDTLWIKKEDESYRQNALAFYKDKTLKRVDKFLNKYNIEDEPDVINGIEVPSIKDMIHEIEFDYLIGKNPTGFHGDFILDNILIDEKKFTLIDWRQDFNGSIDAGDMNYDLAKLNHNLILSHQILANNLFTIECKEEITCDVHVKKSHLECQDYLKQFCYNSGIRYEDIQILTSLIWINMAPLHEHPLDMFLYYFGKYNLFLTK